MARSKNKTRCQKKTLEGSDFCSYHKEKGEYDKTTLANQRKRDSDELAICKNKLKQEIDSIIRNKKIKTIIEKVTDRTRTLDYKYEENLMCISNSWSEIPLSDQIKMDGEYWSIDFMLGHYAQQLNHSLMENPYPVYPSNPFTRAPLSPASVLTIKKRIKVLDKSVNLALKTFLNMDLNTLRKTYSLAVEDPDNISGSLIRLFSEKLRYMLVNSRNSQNSFTGYWVNKTTPKTFFEELYDQWIETPYQIISPVNYEILNNPQKDFKYTVLISLPQIDWGPSNDPTQQPL